MRVEIPLTQALLRVAIRTYLSQMPVMTALGQKFVTDRFEYPWYNWYAPGEAGSKTGEQHGS